MTTIATKVHPRASDYGMLEVSEAAFFATVAKLDVTPYAQGRYDRQVGYLSHWKTPQGAVLGATVGGTSLSSRCFMVTPPFFEANRAALAGAAAKVPA